MVKNDIFDIVLLDLKLPDIDGIKGIGEIKTVSPHSKVIILTGYPSVESVVSTMKDGAIDYLKKPFKNEKLLNIIQNNIDLELKDNILIELGKKIKAVRKAGLTDSTISMIENGKISPSITTFHKIAMAMGVHPVEFFEIEKHKKCVVSRKQERERLQFHDSDKALEYLIKAGRDSQNEIFISYLGPAQKSFNEPITHTGHKLGYVLTGSIELELGEEKIRLNEGDSIFFEGIIPHLWKSTVNQESGTLWVVTF